MTRAGLMRLGVWILILVAWEGAYRLIKWDRTLFPSPSQVLDGALELLNFRSGFGQDFGPNWPKATDGGFGRTGEAIYRGPLITASLTSLIRLGVGFAISIWLGGMLGVAMWRLRGLDEFLGPLFLGFQTLPSVCWVPLSILVFGLRETGGRAVDGGEMPPHRVRHAIDRPAVDRGQEALAPRPRHWELMATGGTRWPTGSG